MFIEEAINNIDINNISFKNCEYTDLEYILLLKELCLKWYIEIIYGWDLDIQRKLTNKELDNHKDDMRIIMKDGKDIGITTFYKENDEYEVGLIMIHPDNQGGGLGGTIINEYIKYAHDDNKTIKIKVYKENPARRLYERLGFILYKEDDTHAYLSIRSK